MENLENYKNEKWLPLPDEPDYEFSNYGRLKNIRRKHIRQPRRSNTGYYVYTLTKTASRPKAKFITAHRMVAELFLPDQWFEGCVVHHLDEDIHNNYVENLQCLTAQEHNAVKHSHKGQNKPHRWYLDPIELISPNGTVTVFSSLVDAADKLSLSQRQIALNARGYREPFTIGQFRWCEKKQPKKI